MPLIPTVMSMQMVAKGASLTLAGSKYNPMVSAVSMATCSYIMASSMAQTTNQVTGPGAGTFQGKIVGCTSSGMSGLMKLKAASQGLAGRDIGKLFDSIAFGVVQSLNTVMVVGSVIGGGPGAGQGKVLMLIPTALQAVIIANLAGKVIAGSKTAQLVSAIAFGICNHIMTAGMITATCVGAFAGPPVGPVPLPVAPGIGKLV